MIRPALASGAACAFAATAGAAQSTLDLDSVLAAIEQVESAGRPWVVFDNSVGESIDSPSRERAEGVAQSRLALGHNLDLGLYQINSIQLRRPEVRLATIFEPAVQADLARTILGEFLARARALYGDGELAWERAIGAYNAGHVDSDNAPYVARVLRAMGRIPLTRPAGAPIDADLSDRKGSDRPVAGWIADAAAPVRMPDIEAVLAAVGAVLVVAALFALGGPVAATAILLRLLPRRSR